jgi:drug/metabolite transporter (DMT)-like permease
MNNLFINNKNIGRTTAIVLLVLTALLWSSGGLLIKLISWNPIAIAGFRSGIAALFILIIIKKPRLTWSLPQVGGAIAYALTVISFVVATKLTTAANAILLQYSAPVYVAIFGGLFLKEKTKPRDWVTIFFVMGGMVLFFWMRLVWIISMAILLLYSVVLLLLHWQFLCVCKKMDLLWSQLF